MTLQYDSEFAEALALIKSGRPSIPPQTALDIRRNNHALFTKVFPKAPSSDIIEQTDYTIESYDGVYVIPFRLINRRSELVDNLGQS